MFRTLLLADFARISHGYKTSTSRPLTSFTPHVCTTMYSPKIVLATLAVFSVAVTAAPLESSRSYPLIASPILIEVGVGEACTSIGAVCIAGACTNGMSESLRGSPLQPQGTYLCIIGVCVAAIEFQHQRLFVCKSCPIDVVAKLEIYWRISSLKLFA
jgi:hypothetical protein